MIKLMTMVMMMMTRRRMVMAIMYMPASAKRCIHNDILTKDHRARAGKYRNRYI